MDRSAFDGTSQKVLFAKQSMNDASVLHSQLHKCNWPTVYKISHRGSGFCRSSSTAAAATRVRVSVVDLCCASHELTYNCGFHLDNGGPCSFINIKAATWSIVSLERRSVIIKFTALKHLSHSEVLHGMVLIASTRGFSFCVISLPPVSL